jgi:phosphoribosylamine--glycine ligase
MDEIVNPVVEGMRAEDREYRGFLYAGLMLTAEGPKVIEFNVRFGDPEAQVVVPMIAGDLAPHLAAAADGSLPATPLSFRPDKHVGVVIASEGYPGACPSGRPISGLSAAQALEGVIVFHAGTRLENASVVTSGGRVLTVVGRAPDFAAAIQRAYDGVQAIAFEGMQYRRDIGIKALPELP